MRAKGTRLRHTVVITGASAGVGRATALEFAREGAQIGLLARGRAGLEAAKNDVEKLGGSAFVLPVDVADAEAVECAAMEIEQRLGPIDVWVNNAMASVFSPVKQMTAEEFKRVTEVTYLGYVYGTLAALRRMLPRNRGIVIQVGSALAYRGIPLQSAYCAAKHAVQGFVDSLRCELLHDHSGVRVTMIQMPALNTPQFGWVKSRLSRKARPMPPIFQPEVAARAIVWASHNSRREMFVGMPTVEAIIGDRIAPNLLDHYLARNGYDGQQHDGAEKKDRPNNLFEPLDMSRDHGAHGDFDQQASGWSLQLWASQSRAWLFLGSIALGAVVLVGTLSRNK
jgi:NAD(P)-dependent dehydrogenase (short-subunit alcohol dehydrogenase family)